MPTLIPFTSGLRQMGLGRTAGYAQKGDLVTEPIIVGVKAMLPQAEAEAQALARVAGFTPEELRELVRRLMKAREALASDEQINAIVQKMQADRLARGAKADPGRPLRVEAARELAARKAAKKAAATRIDGAAAAAVQAHTTPTPTPTRRAPPPKVPPKTKRAPRRNPKEQTAAAT